MMSEWISVKDKLPAKDDYNDYLITDGEHCYVGHYRHDADAWDNSKLGWIQCMDVVTDETYEINITHWMPLPELPNKEIIMEDLFRYKYERILGGYSFGGYSFIDTFDELIEDINNDFIKDTAEEIKEWALNSKKGDGYKKYGVYILNVGKKVNIQ